MVGHVFERGSEWRQWDLHIHSPASFHWKGAKFSADPDSDENRTLIDSMVSALNNAQPEVFCLMDYWTFDGWLALQRRLKEKGAPELKKKVFPGIELRLAAPMTGRLNAHVLFSDEIDEQSLVDFKSALTVEIVNRPLSNASLIQLARHHAVTEEKLKHHGLSKTLVDKDDSAALFAGSTIAEINCDSYKDAVADVPNGHAIGFMPYDTSDGLAEVKWQEHYAYFLGLFSSSPIFESRNHDLRGAFVGEVTPGNAKFIDSFQKGLGRVPRLVVSGSDAHQFVGVKGDNNRRGYGDFPSGKATWIKADPTFRGLQQAIMEPAKRSFIGACPPKIAEIQENKTYFIDRIAIDKTPGSTISGAWLDNVDIPLNPDLVAIIGNKGSGKSALADVIALLGNSRQKAHFSFLKKERFRGKSGDPAKHFVGKLSWLDGTVESRNLNDDAPEDKVELVRYIPQGHFESLCNDHVSGRSNAFEQELRAVIFSHAGESIRLGALDFDQLIEQQESGFRIRLNEYRKDLRRLNQQIANVEEQLQPEVKSALEELLAQKERQIEEHKKLQPPSVSKPDGELSPEQKEAANQLELIANQIKSLTGSIAEAATKESRLAAKSKAIGNIREHLNLLERSYKQFLNDAEKDLAVLGLKGSDLATLAVNSTLLDDSAKVIPDEVATLKKQIDQSNAEKIKLEANQAELKAKLNAPQLQYQQSLIAIEAWQAKLTELVGAAELPETQKGLDARIKQIDQLPDLLKAYEENRIAVAGEIFDVLDAQRTAREELFKPVQDLIQQNSLIRDDYKLQFQATLGGAASAIAASLFALIKQNSGDFRGEDESYATIQRLTEEHDLGSRDGAMEFVANLHAKIRAASWSKGGVGIAPILRKERVPEEVYDLLYGLSFLEPRYSLLFQDTQIEQLSPGQRGALLLIFYLLVDKGRNPIILDQPEENLDNETVVSLLVPVLTEAKRRRQIIMVTHNPNLAVVCDAEQVIWSTFDRKNASKISYQAGAMEESQTNGRVVDVLEGTMPAFTNRSRKYH